MIKNKTKIREKMKILLPLLVICVQQPGLYFAADDKSQALSKAHFEFSLDLYKTLLVNFENNNLIVSPYSINLLLSMLFLGTSSSSNSSRQLR